MSNIYHTEPQTEGKVLIKTSHGDIDIELWSREAPLACRNFIQLSLESYYENCPFHLVIKEFMIQTGDPSGIGNGGTSIWGKPFKDEIHGRIKFNHRGQVAMANESKPNSNHSQFFITLGACEWLDRKHTIFGKVTGNTVYNLLRMGDVEVDAKERPVDPMHIISVEVLWNPFEDILPRLISKIADTNQENQKLKSSSKTARKALKDVKLLSFGDEEHTLDDPSATISTTGRIHSIHDSKHKDAKLSSEVIFFY